MDGDKHETGNFNIELQGNSIEVSPNPASGIFKISFFSFNEGIADIRILSSLGLVVYSGQIVVTPDSNQFEFDLSAFTGGIYYLITRINGFSSRAKLLLLR